MTRNIMMPLLMGLLLHSGLVFAQADASPDVLIKQTAGNMIDSLDTRQEEFEANPEALYDLVRTDLLPIMDVDYSARLILGRAGRDATPEQLADFSTAMSEVLITRYSTGLLEYRNRDQLEVMPIRGELNERMTRVRTRVQLSNGKFVPVDYVFRKTDAGWRAFDVIVEGISYVTTYRNQIMPQVQASGIDQVINRLQNGDLELKN